MGMYRGAVAFLVSLAALAAAAGVAVASQPVTVDFVAQGAATVNALLSTGDCNGAPVYATLTDVIPFQWETRFNTTINNDDTIVDQPGYLVSHDFGSQSANVVGSGGDGSAGCNQAIATSIQSCPQEVQADIIGGDTPRLSDPDRAAQQPGPGSYENVDVQGPMSILNPNPSPSIGCGLGFNDLSMLNASLPDMFTAHIQLPHDIFLDPKTGDLLDSWTTNVSMPANSPIDGSACGAGNNGVSYTSCTKDISWSGTVTITKRPDDCTDGATEPPAPDAKCPPAVPVVPSPPVAPVSSPTANPASGAANPSSGAAPGATVTAVSGPSGNAATTGRALAGGGIPVTVSVSGPGTVSGSLTATAAGSSGHAHDAKIQRLVIATGSVVAHQAGRVTLRLKLTTTGRKLLRSWKRRTLLMKLSLAFTSTDGHKTVSIRTIKLERTTTMQSGTPGRKH